MCDSQTATIFKFIVQEKFGFFNSTIIQITIRIFVTFVNPFPKRKKKKQKIARLSADPQTHQSLPLEGKVLSVSEADEVLLLCGVI